jgi:hypothetical protein
MSNELESDRAIVANLETLDSVGADGPGAGHYATRTETESPSSTTPQ